jgi:hypothetical protein
VRVLQSPDGETLFITQAAGVSVDDARQAAARTSAEGPGPGPDPDEDDKEAPVQEKNEQT